MSALRLTIGRTQDGTEIAVITEATAAIVPVIRDKLAQASHSRVSGFWFRSGGLFGARAF